MSTELMQREALVFRGSDGEPLTTSLVIAEHSRNQHASIMKLIDDNAADLQEIGVIRFEIGKPTTSENGGGRPTRYAVLNESAAALLMTYLRNTPVVKDFKKRLVAGFYAMRQMLTRPESSFDLMQAMLDQLRSADREAREARELAQRANDRVDAIMPAQAAELYYSARAWARINDAHDASRERLRQLGVRAGKVGRAHELTPSRVPDERDGTVNGWPLWVWDQAAEEFGF